MKNKQWVAILLAALIVILLLGGCQLAREDAGEDSTSDRLIGVFITTNYLDLFDFEGDFNSTISSFSGGEIKMDGNQGRLYATLTKRTLTSEESGEKTTTEEYVFDGLVGISYFSAKYSGAEDGETYRGIDADDAISDRNTALHYGDEEEKLSLEGTIYISPILFGQAYYINPVYQSANGNVYATSGSGFGVNSVEGEGSVYSQTLEETKTIIENGESTVVSASIKISIAPMYAPAQIIILQMDKNSNIVARDICTPEDIPEKLTAHADAEYIILESHKTDNEGKPFATRELFSRVDEAASAFYCRDDGVCVKKWIQLVWE